MMLTVVLTPKNLEELSQQVALLPAEAEAMEWRLDYLSELNVECLSEIKQSAKKPVILTLRAEEQGGHFQGDEKKRLEHLNSLAVIQPEFIDFEYSVSDDFIVDFHKKNPEIKIIRSYHNFDETPHDLDVILNQLNHPAVFVYKIVTQAQSSLDVLRILQFLKNQPKRIAAHCMGECGQPSRVLAKCLGSFFSYVGFESSLPSPASGLITLTDMLKIYRANELNEQTQFYALLGDPVQQSIGHVFHNDCFFQQEKKAVYVKLQLKPNELESFFKAAVALPFSGFSVTMPLKSSVLPWVDRFDDQSEAVGAVNTLKIQAGILSATNTDGVAVMALLKKSIQLKEKKLLLLGAGGAAQAIAVAASKENMQITILNRSHERAKNLAEKIQGVAYDFENFMPKQGYDVIISTLPSHLPSIEKLLDLIGNLLTPPTFFLDMNYYDGDSPLALLAAEQGASILSGKAVFIEQAENQQRYWAAER